MTIDTLTVLIALLIGYSMLVLDLWLARRSLMDQRPELRIWAHGSLTMLLGFLSGLLRLWWPLGPSVLLTNVLLATGVMIYTQAVYQFVLRRALPRVSWAVFGGGLVLMAGVVVSGVGYPGLTVAACSWIGLLLVPIIRVLVVEGWRAEPSLRTMAITLLVCWVALVFRGGHAWVVPNLYVSPTQSGWVQGLMLLTAYLAVIGTGFGFLLANFERAAQQMEILASHDDLTGCYNRATARTMLNHLLDRCRRERAPMALVVLDLDHFKRVNDQHGHLVGDRVLRQFAEVVRRRLRASDVFGRMGGEEFCLGLPVTDRQGALEVVEALRKSVEELALTGRDSQSIRVTVSAGVVAIGMAMKEDFAVTVEQLYGEADDLLYLAKRHGRNQVMVA